MQLSQNQEDSSGQCLSKNGQKMKISLFYKSFLIKAYIFVFIFISLTSIPIIVYAGFFSNILNNITGSVQAADKEDLLKNETTHNSQNIPLLESSVDPDMKNMKETPIMMIVEDEALSSSTDFFVGAGLENVSSRDITIYEVQSGDTLSQIAEDFDVSANTIRWENNITGSNIKVGQKLNILPVTGVKHTVKKGDTLSKISSSYDAELEDMLIFNGLEKNSSIAVGDIIFVPNGVKTSIAISKTPSTITPKSSSSSSTTSQAPSGYFIRPVSGKVTSPYGSRRSGFHYGVDIGNKRGTPVVASASGKVTKVVNYCKEGASNCGGKYGNYIIIEHPNGMQTKYAHMGSVSVSLGTSVSQGENIGTVGNTGKSTGPHLHFEVIKSNGSTIKPSGY